MCPWPTGPRHRAVYTRIYIHVVVDDMRMAILCNTRSYNIVWVVTTAPNVRNAVYVQPRLVKETIVNCKQLDHILLDSMIKDYLYIYHIYLYV